MVRKISKDTKGEGKQTNLAAVKELTKSYVRQFEIKAQKSGSPFIDHPITDMILIPNPANPMYEKPTPSLEVINDWRSKNDELLNLEDPAHLEKWLACVDEMIDTTSTLAGIYKFILRPNWVKSWFSYVSHELSFADRQNVEDTIKHNEEEFKAQLLEMGLIRSE